MLADEQGTPENGQNGWADKNFAEKNALMRYVFSSILIIFF